MHNILQFHLWNSICILIRLQHPWRCFPHLKSNTCCSPMNITAVPKQIKTLKIRSMLKKIIHRLPLNRDPLAMTIITYNVESSCSQQAGKQ